jgi:hypothetical protein
MPVIGVALPVMSLVMFLALAPCSNLNCGYLKTQHIDIIWAACVGKVR